MNIDFADTAPAHAEIIVHFLVHEDRAQTPVAVPIAEFSGKPNSLAYFHAERTLCAGLGSRTDVTGRIVRAATGAAARFLQKKGRARIAIQLGPWVQFAQESVEGALLGAYEFDQFKPAPADEPASKLQTITFVANTSDLAGLQRLGGRGCSMGEAANFARAVGNQPPNIFFPETLADAARKLATEHGLSVQILDEQRLREGGFGGLLAVGGGSIRPPRLIVLRYDGGPAGEAPLVFVGKAITFDSGGLSIKQAAGMEEMVWDKCGGTAVFGAMRGVAALQPKRNIAAVIASAENMTGPAAYRPGDIVTVFDGKHIEINNTDAEGRVVLADALGYARKVLGAGAIIDLATLTGGCIVALGDETAGLWSSNDALRHQILAASEKAGEPLWSMPITKEHEDKIKSDIALIKNTSGRAGSPCTAAAFLKTFVEDTPWAHIDLAGPSAITKERADLGRGATGFGVRTLLEIASS